MELVLDGYEGGREVIPDGTQVQALVLEVKDRPSIFNEEDKDGNVVLDEDGQPKKKMQMSFKFKILEGEFKGEEVYGNTNLTFSKHPDCKLRVWVQEILGKDTLKDGFRVDTEMLEGLTCRINIAMRQGKKQADGSFKQTNYVSDVMRDDDNSNEPF